MDGYVEQDILVNTRNKFHISTHFIGFMYSMLYIP